MQNLKDIKSPRHIAERLRRQPTRAVQGTTLRGVRQDNPPEPPARPASRQPSPLKTDYRAHPNPPKLPHAQKENEHKRKTVKLTLWVHPGVRTELERIGKQNSLSLSKTGATALEEWVARRLHIEHAGIITPIIEQAIAKQMRSYSTRIAVLLVRSLFASEQTRSITTNILGRQQGVSQQVLEKILDGSSGSAKRNITRVTPQLAHLVQEVEAWIQEQQL